MKSETLAKIERKLRPLLLSLGHNIAPYQTIKLFSKGREEFLKKLEKENIEKYNPPRELHRTLWGIRFQGPLMNAAGMFKNWECYELSYHQGSAAYIGGTTTWNPREGNRIKGISRPFIPYPRSHSASNNLGLPNDGDKINSARALRKIRYQEFPMWASLMLSQDIHPEKQLPYLKKGISLFEKAGVDIIEINESCPNVEHSEKGLKDRLKSIRNNSPKKIIVVKLSTDTSLKRLPCILDTLFETGIDGVNFGNTSIDYKSRRNSIYTEEKEIYDHFSQNIGGGVSGRPLKKSSLELCARAVEYRNAGPPQNEFHIIRTGGIECAKDLIESDQAGVSMNQWFTGYWEAFSRHGHKLYEEIHKEYLKSKQKIELSIG